MKPRFLPRDSRVTLALSVLLLLFVAAFFAASSEERLPIRRWGTALQSAGLPGMALFLSAGILATAVGLPRQLVAFTGGLAYGMVFGLLVSWLAALGGCHVTVQLSRTWLRARILARYPALVESLSSLLRHDAFLKVLVLRLQPFGTNLLTNLCAGIARIDYPVFLLATAIGYIPQMLVFVLLGVGVRVDDGTRFLVSALLLLVSLLLAGLAYQQHLRRKADCRATERDPPG